MQTLKLAMGPAVAAIIWFSPLSLESETQLCLGLLSWVVLWWVTEAIPIAATALFVPILAVVTGLADAKQAFESFAHPLIFLFMGSFFMARAVIQQHLDRRLALSVLTHPIVAGKTKLMIMALLATTAFLSMWLSNTATTAMMLPISLGVVSAIFPDRLDSRGKLLLPVAYAASIGGIMTPVGSPPNLIAIGLIEEVLGIRISFFDWMLVTTPLAIFLLAILFWMTYRKFSELPENLFVDFLRKELREMGRLDRSEKKVIFCVLLAASLWILPSLLGIFVGKDHEWVIWFKAHLPEPVVAMIAGCLLFVLKDQKARPLLSWDSAKKIDWASLIIFGGGLSLGKIIFESGVAELLGGFVVNTLEGQLWLFLLVAIGFTIFFTEIASNTATANMLIPIILGAMTAASSSDYAAVLGVSIACSLAFMMPISTPPNAIVFGSGLVQLKYMMKKGLSLNLVSWASLFIYLLILGFLGFIS